MMQSQKLFTISARTRIGSLGVLGSTAGLWRVCWPGSKAADELDLLPVSEAGPETRRLLKATAKELAQYFAGQKVRFSRRFDLSTFSPFAQEVLRELTKVDYGQTTSYGQLAKRVGKAGAARAVGAVLGRNPLPIIIPCHRVLTAGGLLGGFTAPGGSSLKRRLMNMEADG